MLTEYLVSNAQNGLPIICHDQYDNFIRGCRASSHRSVGAHGRCDGCVMTQRHVITADVSHPIDLTVGDFAVVELVENPTTGFRWHIETAPQLVLLGSEWTVVSSGAVGASGVRRFTFRADAAGTARVYAKLWRSWVGDSSVIRRHSFVFSIG
jgi:inhibitor of cysteine peptidase